MSVGFKEVGGTARPTEAGGQGRLTSWSRISCTVLQSGCTCNIHGAAWMFYVVHKQRDTDCIIQASNVSSSSFSLGLTHSCTHHLCPFVHSSNTCFLSASLSLGKMDLCCHDHTVGSVYIAILKIILAITVLGNHQLG